MARGLVAALSSPARPDATAAPLYSTGTRRVRATARPVGGSGRRRGRGLTMVVRAGGPPSTNVLILAFVLPLSLFVGTLVAAARVADDLDERFLREMEINRAILEENESSDEDSGDEEEDDGREYDEGEEEEDEEAPVEKREAVVVGAAAAATPTRIRNRPRRLV